MLGTAAGAASGNRIVALRACVSSEGHELPAHGATERMLDAVRRMGTRARARRKLRGWHTCDARRVVVAHVAKVSCSPAVPRRGAAAESALVLNISPAVCGAAASAIAGTGAIARTRRAHVGTRYLCLGGASATLASSAVVRISALVAAVVCKRVHGKPSRCRVVARGCVREACVVVHALVLQALQRFGADLNAERARKAHEKSALVEMYPSVCATPACTTPRLCGGDRAATDGAWDVRTAGTRGGSMSVRRRPGRSCAHTRRLRERRVRMTAAHTGRRRGPRPSRYCSSHWRWRRPVRATASVCVCARVQLLRLPFGALCGIGHACTADTLPAHPPEAASRADQWR